MKKKIKKKKKKKRKKRNSLNKRKWNRLHYCVN